MTIDWNVVIKIAAPIIALFIGVFLNKVAEDKPRLICYLSHTFSIRFPVSQDTILQIHTHSIVIKNIGRKPAKNVKIGHKVLPAFQVHPSINYKVQDLPTGGKEIVIPTLVPKEQIVINYLYIPPLIWTGINSYTKSDEGFARIVNVLLTRQYSKRFQVFVGAIFLLGLTSAIYLLFLLGKWIAGFIN